MTLRMFFRILLLTISIWLVAAIINGVIVSIVMNYNMEGGLIYQLFIMVLLISGMFSLPGFVLFMIIFFIIHHSESLFEKLLVAASLLTVLSVLLFFLIIPEFSLQENGWTMIPALVGTIIAMVIHQKYIQQVYLLSTQSLPEEQ